MNDNLKLKLETLPKKPGCYLMKDKTGKIIYVGKAKVLYNRVNSYFIGAHNYKTTKLVSKIDDFEYFITNTEKEALVLEINLIKKHRPRFNIQLMDDKTYPYIKLVKYPFPRVSLVRERKRDKSAKYFGPYPNVGAARVIIQLINELYPLQKCYPLKKKVCLYYHLNQCLAPCEFDVDEVKINELYNNCLRFLKGDTKDLIASLRQKMYFHSENMEFEKASNYKKLIDSIDYVNDKQQVEIANFVDTDIFNYYVDKGFISLQALFIRNGKLLDKELSIQPLYSNSIEEEFDSFIMQYYNKHQTPKELVLPLSVDIALFKEELDTKVVQPYKGVKKKLLDLCLENAKNNLIQKFEIINKKTDDLDEANEQLNMIFNKEIKRVELFDNSHISGKFTVAACVVFDYGVANKKEYRHYKITDSANDLESMREVLYRRYFRLLKDDLEMPDLIIVDGGKLQIDICKDIISSLGLNIEICGLVKDDKHQTANLMNFNYEILDIDKKSPLFFLLTRMQDEVHNFAINYHKLLRKKSMNKSILDEVNGIGPSRKKALMKHFKSFKAIKEASLIELEEVLPKNVAEEVYNLLQD